EHFCFPGAVRRAYNRAAPKVADHHTGEPSMRCKLFALAVIIALPLAGTFASAGGDKKADVSPKTPLWPDGAPGAVGENPEDIPTVTVYLAPADKANGAAVVICPGGGYGALAMDHEGHQVARWLNSLGVAGIILQYRLGPRYRHPAPLHDAQRAIRYVRANARQWKIDPARVGILGFS